MSILNSRFDVISHDPHPNARAGLMTVLAVAGAPGPGPTGTPTPGTMIAGTIVAMNNVGAAVPADEVTTGAFPALLFTAIDGDVDYDGAFVHRVTCIQGGMELLLDVAANCVGVGAVVPGTYLTVGTGATAGQWVPAAATDQIYGIVGAQGLDTVNGTLHVIVPQGISPAAV